MKLPEEAINIGPGTWYSKCLDGNGNWVAIDEYHINGDELCYGWVPFDVESPMLAPDSEKWTVLSWEPLSLAPSLHCLRCGHHGFITSGTWVPA